MNKLVDWVACGLVIGALAGLGAVVVSGSNMLLAAEKACAANGGTYAKTYSGYVCILPRRSQ